MDCSEVTQLSKADKASALYHDVIRRIKAAQTAVAQAGAPAELAGPLQDLASLRSWVTEVHDEIPSRDQNTYATALEQLNADIVARRAALTKAKGKFSFKRTSAARPAASTSTSAKAEVPGSTALPTPIVRPTRRWEHQEGQTLSASDPALSGSGDLHLTDLDGCVVDLRGVEGLQAVFVRQVRRSVLLLGSVEGSVLLHGCETTLVVVQCRQYRMHDSVGCVCLLATQGAITIEGCRKLRIGQLPGAGKAGEVQVQDFDHVAHLTSSPNWALCEDGAAVLRAAMDLFARGRPSAKAWETLLAGAP